MFLYKYIHDSVMRCIARGSPHARPSEGRSERTSPEPSVRDCAGLQFELVACLLWAGAASTCTGLASINVPSDPRGTLLGRL